MNAVIRRPGRPRKFVPQPDCNHGDGAKHDCAYVDWRESLIPKAENLANAKHPDLPDGTREERRRQSVKWDAEFHREMRRLTSDPFALANVTVLQ